jgi:hypothetical protein
MAHSSSRWPGEWAKTMGRMLRGIVLLMAGMVIISPATAAADPLTQTDRQYLASLQHGGLCCPDQSDIPNPILKVSPAVVVGLGGRIGADMKATPTYANFQRWRSLIDTAAKKDGLYLDPHEAGKVVIIATHFYGGAAAECSLMKEMGGAMGEAPYWYGPVTYSGGLAVQPGCIDFTR